MALHHRTQYESSLLYEMGGGCLLFERIITRVWFQLVVRDYNLLSSRLREFASQADVVDSRGLTAKVPLKVNGQMMDRCELHDPVIRGDKLCFIPFHAYSVPHSGNERHESLLYSIFDVTRGIAL